MTNKTTRPLGVVVGINICLGLLLWFGFLTDYEFSNTVANLLFPLLVLAVGILTLRKARARRSHRERNWLLLACAPSLVGGVCYALVLAAMCVMILPAMFWVSEQRNAARIQIAPSPDGRKTAYVYFIPVGAYSGGKGRIVVKLHHSWLPFVRREVYHRRVSYADARSANYVSWDDRTSLRISEDDSVVRVGWIRFERPLILAVPMRLLGR